MKSGDMEVEDVVEGEWLIRVYLRWAESAQCYGGFTKVYRGDRCQFRIALSGHFVDRDKAQAALVEKSKFWMSQWSAIRP